jgi:2-polyprenyl-6-methoxyphenol hydroxylase-like FAD-dependent oxidoreductase
MRIGILGAGPAGLYAATLIKRARPDAEIVIYDQSPADATWGFGVVFSKRALEFLRDGDPETADLIEPEMESWDDITISHKGEKVKVDGIGFSAIGRLEMLKLLQKQAAKVGVEPIYDTRVDDISVFDDADLVIAADGLNSVVRAEAPQAYGEKTYFLHNRFAWYGTSKPFGSLTQTFKETEYGFFNVHHYRFSPNQSTFLIECDEHAFRNSGFEKMQEVEYRKICEDIFSEELEGHKLINNNSIWRRFPVLENTRWFHKNRVLVGDALHTAHYSIGSGTRLAMEDVIALVGSLKENDFNVSRALPAYQENRQHTLTKLTAAALSSALWYENFGEHMALDPWQMARSYVLRSGRLSIENVAKISPQFVEQLNAHEKEAA